METIHHNTADMNSAASLAVATKKALNAAPYNAFTVEPESVIVIGLDTKDGPEHCLWDERINLPISEEMIESIRADGVREAITVRKSGGFVEVINGRQRVIHARELNRRNRDNGLATISIPCNRPERVTDAEAYALSITLNNVRRDDSPIVKARKANRLMRQYGYSEERASVVVGAEIQVMRSWLKLLDLDDTVQNAVVNKDLGANAAAQLGSLPRAQQAEMVKQLKDKAAEKQAKADARAEAKAAKSRKNGAATGVLFSAESDGGTHKAAAPSKPAKKPAKPKRATARDVKAMMGKIVAPNKRLVNKILKLDGAKELHPHCLKAIRWMQGEIGPDSIAGLAALIREATEGK